MMPKITTLLYGSYLFEGRAFFAMIDRLEAYIDSKKPKQSQGDKWVLDEKAMRILRLSSKTTLQKFRDEGKIRYSQPEKKIILYDADSIPDFIEDFTYETF